MSSKIELIVDKKLLKIIKLFLNKNKELFHLQKISQEAKVPLGTTFRLIKKLSKTGLIKTQTVGKTKLYKTDKKIAKEFQVLK
jgi:Mn-dependent DtxR family transcriptional regulator